MLDDSKYNDPLYRLRMLTVDEVCGLVRYTRQHLSRMEKNGEFPARIPFGAGRVVYRLMDIDHWIECRRTGTPWRPILPRAAVCPHCDPGVTIAGSASPPRPRSASLKVAPITG